MWDNPYEHSMISRTPALQHMVEPIWAFFDLAFHIILWLIALVTCAAACREAILPENSLVP